MQGLSPGTARFGVPGGDSAGGPSPWIPIIGSVAGAAIDAWSNQQTNKASAKQAQEARDFEKQQTDTALQRGKADAIAAGYNPGLLYQQGGASNASATPAPQRPITENTGVRIAQAVDAYNQLATGTAQRQLIRAQTDATQRQALFTGTQTSILNAENSFKQSPSWQRLYQAANEAGLTRTTQENQNYPEQFKARMNEIAAGIKYTAQQTETSAAQAQLLRTQSTLNEQDFTNAYFRKNIAPYINSTAATVRAFKPVVNLRY